MGRSSTQRYIEDWYLIERFLFNTIERTCWTLNWPGATLTVQFSLDATLLSTIETYIPLYLDSSFGNSGYRFCKYDGSKKKKEANQRWSLLCLI